MSFFDRLRALWARLRGRDVFRDGRGRLRYARTTKVPIRIRLTGEELMQIIRQRENNRRRDLS